MTEQALFKRLLFSIALFFVVFVLGALGFWLIEVAFAPEGVEPMGLLEAFYMSAITVTTVGYGLDYSYADWGESAETVGLLYTICYLIFSYLSVVYASANIVAALVEGAVGKLWMKHIMEKILSNIKDHYIVCGAGTTGHHVIDELLKNGHTVVVIDHSKSIEEEYMTSQRVIPIVGDATQDELLTKAGVERAAGIFAALSDDKDNLVIALTARQLSSKIRVVGRAIDFHTVAKLRAVGANSVVSPNHIGGLRMASEMIRPGVVTFLDTMLRKSDANVRFSEVRITEDMKAAGHKLKDLDIPKKVGLTIVAILQADGSIRYNPGQDALIQAGDALIVIADSEKVAHLEEYLRHSVRTTSATHPTEHVTPDIGAEHGVYRFPRQRIRADELVDDPEKHLLRRNQSST